MNEGLLIARLVFGLIMAAHGSQKLFGWFGGYGLDGTAGFFESIGFRPGRLFATAAALSEILSGLLLALGFLGPIGPALMLAVMVVASSVHWSHGLFAQNNGIEVPLLYAVVAIALALTGFGRISVDAAIGLNATPMMSAAVLVLGAAGGVGNLALRRRTAATA